MFAKQIKYLSHLSILILIIGAILRLKVYLDNRDFFIDEINLCRNIVTKNLAELLQPLEFGQHAPPLFLTISKWISQIGGISEYSFRLLPLIAGLASLVVFYKLCRHFIAGPALVFPVTLFSFSTYLVEYSTTAKQYSIDVFTCLLLTYFALKIKKGRNLFAFSLFAAICVWLSMPSIFILAAIGFYLLAENYKVNKFENLNSYRSIILFGTCTLASFGIYYFLILSNSLSSDYLQDFHLQYFLPVPDSKEDTLLFIENIVSLFRSIVGKTTIPIITAILLYAIGISSYWKKSKSEVILLVGPILFCLVASMLSMYSLLIRLTLFLLPFLMLTMGIGLESLFEKIKILPKKFTFVSYLILTTLIVLCIPQRNALHFFAKPLLKEQSKASLKFIEDHTQNESPIYILHNAEPAFTYYTRINDKKIVLLSEELFFAKWDSDFRRKAKEWKNAGHEKVWIFDCHTFGEPLKKIQREINEAGKVVDEFVDVNGYARLVLIE